LKNGSTSRLWAQRCSRNRLLGLGFFAFLLFSSNPFERLDPAPPAGAGLNPLLQDIGLAFHPPTLYIGYVGLSVAFSFAVAALLTGKVGPTLLAPCGLGAAGLDFPDHRDHRRQLLGLL
jgi:cytochrome c-type biogenesis protein CcmF